MKCLAAWLSETNKNSIHLSMGPAFSLLCLLDRRSFALHAHFMTSKEPFNTTALKRHATPDKLKTAPAPKHTAEKDTDLSLQIRPLRHGFQHRAVHCICERHRQICVGRHTGGGLHRAGSPQ